VLGHEGTQREAHQVSIRLEPFGDVRRELGQRYPLGRLWPAPVAQEFQDLDVVFRFKEFAEGPPHRPVEADAMD
jgi:hypothetical protein